MRKNNWLKHLALFVIIMAAFMEVFYIFADKDGFSVTPPAFISGRPILRVACEAGCTPLAFHDARRHPTGHNVELIYAIGKVMGVNISVALVDWEHALSGLRDGKFQAVLCATRSHERGEEMELSDTVFTDHFVCYGKKIELFSFAMWKSKAIATVTATAISREFLIPNDLKDAARPYQSWSACLTAVENDSCDFTLIPEQTAKGLVKELGFTDLVSNGIPLCDINYCIGSTKGDTQLAQRLNHALFQLAKSGESERIKKRWFTRYDAGSTPFARIIANNALFFTCMLALGLLLFLAAVMVAITREQRRRIQALQASRQALQEQLAVTHSFGRAFFYACHIDLSSRRFYAVNEVEYISGLIGESGDAARAADIFVEEMVCQEFRETMRQFTDPDTLAVRLGSGEVVSQEYRGRKLGWMRASIIVVDRDHNRRAQRVLFAVQPIDSEKAKELENLQALQAELAATQKENAAKSNFLTKLSHDIRTPMNAIVGMTILARSAPEDAVQTRDCLDKISQASDILLALINDVLDLARLQSGNMHLRTECLNLEEQINSSLMGAASSAAAQNITIARDFSLQHDHVIGDVSQLHAIIINLVGNAIKHTPENGTITVKLRETGTTGTQPKQAAYELKIHDNGAGITPELLPHVFEPFNRDDDEKGNGQGTGLGLAIVKNIVNMLGGSIFVKSEPGQGTEFTLTLHFPVAETAEIAAAPKPETPAAPLPPAKTNYFGRHALLAEDHAVNAEVASKFLKKTQLTVERAENGQMAVEMFAESPVGYYDIIFMDIQMPKINGHDAARTIRGLPRADAQTVPIIAMTANAFSSDIHESLNAGMNAHLAKPVDINKLYTILAQWIDAGRQGARPDATAHPAPATQPDADTPVPPAV